MSKSDIKRITYMLEGKSLEEISKTISLLMTERDHHKKWSDNYEQGLRDSHEQIEKLRSLISELLPYMLNDMEQGLTLGQPPFEQDHCKDKDTPCPDCQWFEDATLWKNRVDAGEFKDYI